METRKREREIGMETRQMKREAREPAAAKREKDHKSMYICSVEEYGDRFSRYRVQAIKLSDLFSFSDTTTPITIYPAGSKSEFDSSSVIREVALLEGGGEDVLPFGMGFGVFRSQIILAGGWFLNAKIFDSPKPFYVLDTTYSQPRFVIDPNIEAIPGNKIAFPSLHEFQGKLCVLSSQVCVARPSQPSPDDTWQYFPRLPYPGQRFSCFVLGGRMFATHTNSNTTYLYDPGNCAKRWAEFGRWDPWDELPLSCFHFEGASHYRNHILVLDTENESEKLMFTFGYSTIVVHFVGLRQSDCLPERFQHVADIDVPSIPNLSGCEATSYSSVHLGDRDVCFSVLYPTGYKVQLLVLPFRYAFSSSGKAVHIGGTSDQNSLKCTTFWGSFAARALGCHLFEYDSFGWLLCAVTP